MMEYSLCTHIHYVHRIWPVYIMHMVLGFFKNLFIKSITYVLKSVKIIKICFELSKSEHTHIIFTQVRK